MRTIVSVLLLSSSLLAAQQVSTERRQSPSPVMMLSNGDRLDLNTATPVQLAALPGMGKEYVRRVIANRPYTAKNQLVTRGVLPQMEYERIADFVVAHRPGSSSSHD